MNYVEKIKCTEMTEDEFEEFVDSQLEEGWRPENLEGTGCSCHIHPPCSYCCIEKCDEIKEEIMEEFNINIKGTGEGETKVYTHGSIEHEGERWIRSIDHENLIALARQEQREAMVEVVEGIIQEERFAGAPYALNEVIKAIKNLK